MSTREEGCFPAKERTKKEVLICQVHHLNLLSCIYTQSNTIRHPQLLKQGKKFRIVIHLYLLKS